MSTMVKVVLPDQNIHPNQINQLMEDLQAQVDPNKHHTLLLKQHLLLVYHRKTSMHILLTMLDYL